MKAGSVLRPARDRRVSRAFAQVRHEDRWTRPWPSWMRRAGPRSRETQALVFRWSAGASWRSPRACSRARTKLQASSSAPASTSPRWPDTRSSSRRGSGRAPRRSEAEAKVLDEQRLPARQPDLPRDPQLRALSCPRRLRAPCSHRSGEGHARNLGIRRAKCGAVTFVQRFGGALNLNSSLPLARRRRSL